MTVPHTTVIGALIVAACLLLTGGFVAGSILVAFRWDVALGSGQPQLVRLDRWTGTVTACNVDPAKVSKAQEYGGHAAVDMDCDAP